MIERDGYPPGVPCWIDCPHRDRDGALAFYGELFGWSFENRMPAGDRAYDVARLGGRDVAAIGSGPDPIPAAWNTYVWVESADEAAAKVEQAGGKTVSAPFDVHDAGRMAMFTDPAGAAFSVWQARNHRGAQLVNEPGTWNWSLLHTPDPAAAAAFYGEVFGWEVNLGDGPAMVRRPGYAEFLERSDPGLRERHAEHGAPEGFSDSIAWIVRDEGQPRWEVTFSVADADSVARLAETRGGTVVTAPHDTEWTREADLRDPEGATFTISAFRPPESA